MTDIKWLVDILLNYKLPKEVKDLFIARIGQIEESLYKPQPRPNSIVQSPSTQKLLDDMAQQTGAQVPAIAATPAAANALASRQAAIKAATSNVPEPGRTGPRKF